MRTLRPANVSAEIPDRNHPMTVPSRATIRKTERIPRQAKMPKPGKIPEEARTLKLAGKVRKEINARTTVATTARLETMNWLIPARVNNKVKDNSRLADKARAEVNRWLEDKNKVKANRKTEGKKPMPTGAIRAERI